MNRTALCTVPVLVCLAGLGSAAAVDATSASAHPAQHTLRISFKQLQHKIVNGKDLAVDKQLQHGAITGYDASSCKINISTHVASCDLGVARSQGMMFVHARINVTTGKGHGRVLGGTRGYKNATGTVSVQGSHVTIVYSA